MRESVLMRVMGNIGDAICAEPAIRQHLKNNQHLDHYVQTRCPEFYIDYEGIKGSFHLEDSVNRKNFTHYRRCRPDWKNHIVDYLPNRLKITLEDRIPNFQHLPDEDLQECRIPFLLDDKVIAVSVFPSNMIRDWDRSNWIELVDRIKAEGFKVIHMGRNEEPLENVDWDLVNKTSTRQTMTIMRKIRLLVAIDSGLSHVAPAMGTKCVCIFGAVDPKIRVHEGWTIPVHSGACTKCFPTYKGNKRCPLGHHDCMKLLTVQQVFEAVQETLKTR